MKIRFNIIREQKKKEKPATAIKAIDNVNISLSPDFDSEVRNINILKDKHSESAKIAKSKIEKTAVNKEDEDEYDFSRNGERSRDYPDSDAGETAVPTGPDTENQKKSNKLKRVQPESDAPLSHEVLREVIKKQISEKEIVVIKYGLENDDTDPDSPMTDDELFASIIFIPGVGFYTVKDFPKITTQTTDTILATLIERGNKNDIKIDNLSFYYDASFEESFKNCFAIAGYKTVEQYNNQDWYTKPEGVEDISSSEDSGATKEEIPSSEDSGATKEEVPKLESNNRKDYIMSESPKYFAKEYNKEFDAEPESNIMSQLKDLSANMLDKKQKRLYFKSVDLVIEDVAALAAMIHIETGGSDILSPVGVASVAFQRLNMAKTYPSEMIKVVSGPGHKIGGKPKGNAWNPSKNYIEKFKGSDKKTGWIQLYEDILREDVYKNIVENESDNTLSAKQKKDMLSKFNSMRDYRKENNWMSNRIDKILSIAIYAYNNKEKIRNDNKNAHLFIHPSGMPTESPITRNLDLKKASNVYPFDFIEEKLYKWDKEKNEIDKSSSESLPIKNNSKNYKKIIESPIRWLPKWAIDGIRAKKAFFKPGEYALFIYK